MQDPKWLRWSGACCQVLLNECDASKHVCCCSHTSYQPAPKVMSHRAPIQSLGNPGQDPRLVVLLFPRHDASATSTAALCGQYDGWPLVSSAGQFETAYALNAFEFAW